jgi:hypothetical protein
MRRVGFAIRYISSRNSQINATRNSAALVRGRNFGAFDMEVAPKEDFDPEAMSRHPAIIRRGMNIIFDGAPARLRPQEPRRG